MKGLTLPISDCGFFVFGDISVRPEGLFRLRFVLYELLE